MSSRSTSGYRSFDAFAKPIDGIRNKTTAGGVTTILATSLATILFISQIILYYQIDVQNSLALAPSFPLNIVIPTEGSFSTSLLASKGGRSQQRKKKYQGVSSEILASVSTLAANRVDVFVHITFPKLNCAILDYAHNSARFSTGKFTQQNGLSKFTKRRPTEYDFAVAMGMPTADRSKRKTDTNPASENACTIRGSMTVPRIGGDLSFFLSEESFKKTALLLQTGIELKEADKQTGGHEVHHYIHDITFGDHFPLATNPLRDVMIHIDHESGISLNVVSAKLISTKYKRFARRNKDTFQISMSNYIVKPEVLMHSNPIQLPGLSIKYDFHPIAVYHVESRENFFVFLSSLIGIVGGVFVTVKLVSSVLVSSAQMMKKID